LKLAFDALSAGGTAPCVLNAANEIAVDKFLKKEIKFSHIPKMIDNALNKFERNGVSNLDTIFEFDKKTREYVRALN
jgi:1-deoxy-D-xylulose-5-phosphate reductoisomerase